MASVGVGVGAGLCVGVSRSWRAGGGGVRGGAVKDGGGGF